MVSQKIKHVTIKRLWGVKNISTDFKDDVNIFIGTNGSSKTTFLNLIEATLLVDFNMFSNIEFENIIIDFISSDKSKTSTITVTKKATEDSPLICYSFDGTTEIEIPCNEYLLQRSSYRVSVKYRESIASIKEQLNNIINISWLSVNRDNINPIEFERRELLERFKNMVDIKLQELVRGLIMYQLQLESEVNKIANKFKEDVLSLMLYDEKADLFNIDIINRIKQVNTQQIQGDLYRAFSTLGVGRDKRDAVQKHIQSINSVIDKIIRAEKIEIDDVYILFLINKSLSIIQISQNHELQKNAIFAPLDNFWKYLNGFMDTKKFTINKESRGDIDITVNENSITTSINITSLSSGEKQLFILLTEALLQKNKPYLFIADEPELSLHIGWQKQILKELLKLNSNAQIIVATHSPEVAGSFPENIINMKNIISYE
jgi:ABC-type cobalamin/Fe3+-siderophores transport system ATPase subunit